MAALRDRLVTLLIASAAEAYLILHFAPQWKPFGGLGRMAEWCFLANLTLFLGYRWFIYPFFLSPLRKIPGPSGGNILVGHGPATFSKPPGAKMLKWFDEVPNDGLIHTRGFFNQDVLFPTSHETLKTVLSDNTYDYEKPTPLVTILRRVLGDGLILVEGDVHKFQRKHLMPSFQLKHIRQLYPTFWKKACQMTQMLVPEKEQAQSANDEIEFGDWCTRVTLDIIGIAGFGRDFGALVNPEDELVKQYNELLEPSNEKLTWFALNIVFPQWIMSNIPWNINTKLKNIQKVLNDYSMNMVKERRKEFGITQEGGSDRRSSTMAVKKTDPDSAPNGRNDILSLLVASNDFTDHELAEQVLTMMAAGHETTSSTLSWCAYLLAKNPELQDKVRQEVRGALPSPSDPNSTITAAQVDSLTLLNAVCSETLRLYPTVPMTVREVKKETPLNGYIIPKDTSVELVPYAINRSKHFWGADAQEFKPERWINPDGTVNKTGGSSSNYAQLTFLHGPRSCIGQNFAQSELKCLLAAFVGRYSFELSRDESTYFPAGLVTTKPASGMWLRLKAVEGW